MKLRSSNLAKWLSNTIILFGLKANSASRRIAGKMHKPAPTLKALGWENFVKAGGEQLRMDYQLNKDSILFDIGGYDGQFASDFYSKYRCKIFIFEAHKPFADQIAERFKRNSDIQVFDFGLASADGEMEISIDSVASSTFKKTENMAKIHLREANAFLDEKKVKEIDLMKINIEGGEYDLLHHLIKAKKIQLIKNIQIQFHDFVPDATSRMLELRKLLATTHQSTYLCDFIWENWKLKEQ